jgi:hypothetical protein
VKTTDGGTEVVGVRLENGPLGPDAAAEHMNIMRGAVYEYESQEA